MYTFIISIYSDSQYYFKAVCVLCKEINELFRSPRAARNSTNGGDTSRIAMSIILYIFVQHEILKYAIKSIFFYLIVLIPLECCSCCCKLSFHYAFMLLVSVKAAKSELNSTRTHERTHGRTINLYRLNMTTINKLILGAHRTKDCGCILSVVE